MVNHTWTELDGSDNDVTEVTSGHLPGLRKTTKHFSRDCLCLSEIRTAASGRQAKELQPMSTDTENIWEMQRNMCKTNSMQRSLSFFRES